MVVAVAEEQQQKEECGFAPLPWERQHGESATRFHAFCHYRDMEPAERSLAAAYKKHLEVCGVGAPAPKSQRAGSRWPNWSSEDEWVKRVLAYDDHQDAEKRRAAEKARVEMVERHVKVATGFIGRIAQRLSAIDPNEIQARDLPRWLDIAVKVERLSRGEPTDDVKQRQTAADGSSPVEIVDPLAELEQRLEAIAKKGTPPPAEASPAKPEEAKP